jgi:putative spermidine/putrescine transport system permease protein
MASTRPRTAPQRVGRWFVIGLVGLFVLYIVTPFVAVAMTAFGEGWFGGRLFPERPTLRWMEWAVSVTNVGRVIANSAIIAAISIVVSLAVGIPTAWALARRSVIARSAVMTFLLLPQMIPPIAFALGIAQTFFSLRLIDTHIGVALAHATLIVPFVVLIMMSAFEELDARLLEAAAVCGAGPGKVARHVIAPLAMPGVVAAVIFAFVTSYNEFTLTLMTYGPKTLTLTVQTYLAIGDGFFEVASAISVILLIPSFLMLVFLQRRIREANIIGGMKGV